MPFNPGPEPEARRKTMHVNIVLVPDMVQLDATGPFEVLARVPGWTFDFVAASLEPVRTERGLTIVPTGTRETAPPSALFVVPGGSGIDRAMLDPAWVAYTRREAERASFVFGICTGSLLLAAAGVLAGRKAGGHWLSRALLGEFGVVPSDERMTIDGKFYTSGGVTSGIDMALRVVADLVDEATARKIPLQIEYDPAPPFVGGTPMTSPPEITAALREAGQARCAKRERMVAEAATRLRESMATSAIARH
jgi:cyclohexyl-isocyanide hydratase